MTDIIITPSHLRQQHTYACSRRTWLDLHGDPSERTPLPSRIHARLEMGITHETAVQASTPGQFIPVAAQNWDDAVSITHDLLKSGVSVIQQACLETIITLPNAAQRVRLRGKIDRLVLVEHSESPSTARGYVPIEIKRAQRSTPADAVQMDCYIFLVAQTGYGLGPIGEFWLGQTADGSPYREQHSYDPQRLEEQSTPMWNSFLAPNRRRSSLQAVSTARG